MQLKMESSYDPSGTPTMKVLHVCGDEAVAPDCSHIMHGSLVQ